MDQLDELDHPTMNLPHFDPVVHSRLHLPPDFMFRRFVVDDLHIPSVEHAMAMSNVVEHLGPIVGLVACRKLVDWTIRKHLLAIAGPAPPFVKYCETKGASTRQICFQHGAKDSSTDDLGFYYANVSLLFVLNYI